MADDVADPVFTASARPGASVDGNRIELIESGEDRLRAILELIAGAKESLRILFYIFNPDWAGGLIRDALVEAARRGVSVKLLVDGYGSAAQPKFFSALQKNGGETCVFNPSYGRRYLLRNHQKLAIADGRLAITGGANIDDTYLSDEGPRHWRDLWVSIDGPCVSCASDYFDALYRWSTRKHAKLRSLRRLVGHFSQWRGPVQWKFSGPLSMKNSWWRSIGRDINRGSALEMIFAYFAPPGAMLLRADRHLGQVRQQRHDRRSAAQLQPPAAASRADVRIPARQAAYQARDHRRRRLRWLVQLRLPEPLHQPGGDAAGG
jgi:cardiolipin synthase